MKSTSYHDYVFKDGKLLGRFDDMYKYSSSTPWHQDEQENWIDVLFTKELLKNNSYEEIHDFGCGLGYYLNILDNIINTKSTKCYGYDISQTACNKAKEIFPNYYFKQLNLMETNTDLDIIRDTNKRRLFSIRGTLWYVFPKMGNVVQNIAKFMETDEELLIVQNFPPLENDFIGKDVIADYFDIEKHFSQFFTPIKKVWYQDTQLTTNDNWYIAILKKI